MKTAGIESAHVPTEHMGTGWWLGLPLGSP
jgi:hypothetical protein